MPLESRNECMRTPIVVLAILLLVTPMALAQTDLETLLTGSSSQEGNEGTAPPEGDLGDRLREEYGNSVMVVSLLGLAAPLVGLAAFGLVTRYISPKEALKNPQRAMLYGYLKATPGAHLKQLSDEFGMKTSSILWHIRKLESAELVRSDRANGFRVFYATEGGVEARRLGRAMTVLQNENGAHIHQYIHKHPEMGIKQISEGVNIQASTVRWHVRKLKEFGLVEETSTEGLARFQGTVLGQKALQVLEGKPVELGNVNARPTSL